jgi:periplasmic protein TonB
MKKVIKFNIRDRILSLALAFLCLCLFFLGLPFLEVLFRMRSDDTLHLRQIDTLRIKERLIPEPEKEKKFESVPKVKKPKMIVKNITSAKSHKMPVVANMSFQLPKLSAGVGDVALGVDYSTVMGVGGLEQAVFEIGELDNIPIPLIRPSPIYPGRAKNRRIEGFVEIEFVVDKQGLVQNPKIISSNPAGYFESSAMNTIVKWKFIPGKINNQPVLTRVRQKMSFKLGSN